MTSILNVFSILSHSREKVSPMSSFLILEEKDLLYKNQIGVCISVAIVVSEKNRNSSKGNINCAYLLNLLSKPAKQKIHYFNLCTLIVS